jgi:hypothetical protein
VPLEAYHNFLTYFSVSQHNLNWIAMPLTLIQRYTAPMDTQARQKMSIYFPPELLALVRQSAVANHRSFNKEVLHILSIELKHHAEQSSREQKLDVSTLSK